MPVLSRDREEDVPECSGWEISQIFGKKRFPENGIRERRPLLLLMSLFLTSFRCQVVPLGPKRDQESNRNISGQLLIIQVLIFDQ